MSLSPYVFDASAENFNRLVLENSHKGPVLVHFWTPKAGPCFILMPRLVKLAAQYSGKFPLAIIHTAHPPPTHGPAAARAAPISPADTMGQTTS